MAFIDINCNAGTSFYSKLRAETRTALTVFLPLSCASSEKILICEKQLHPVLVLELTANQRTFGEVFTITKNAPTKAFS